MSAQPEYLPNQAQPASLAELREALAFLTGHYDRLRDGTVNTFVWLWEAVQGDFNLERSAGQIAFDTAISMVPIVDQICDVRDIVANCRHINEDPADRWAWVAIVLSLIGLFPTLGSLIKGVLKIFFLFVRRSGGRQIASAVDEAMTWVVTFLRRPEVMRYWQRMRIDDVFAELARLTRRARSQITVPRLLQAFDRGVSLLRNIVGKVDRIPVMGRRARATLDMVVSVRRMADTQIRQAVQPALDVMEAIARRLDAEHLLYRQAVVNTRAIHFRGTLPEATAVRLMRQADPPPTWLKRGEPTYPGLEPDRVRSQVSRATAGPNGHPRLTDKQIRSFHRMVAAEIRGPAKLYRVLSPGSQASAMDWMTEETFNQLQRAADPKAAWRGGLGVWPQWNANGQFVVYEIPPGASVKVWRGPAASQQLDDLPGYFLEGGLEQIKFDAARVTERFRLPDAMGIYRRDARTGAVQRTSLSYEDYLSLEPAEQMQHLSLREEIRHPRISGSRQTEWNYTDFDAQLSDVRLGLPHLPGQLTNKGLPDR